MPEDSGHLRTHWRSTHLAYTHYRYTTGTGAGPGTGRPRAGTCVGPAHATSLFNRYMKAQLRLVGGRRKLGRNGLSSDRPRGCLALPNLRDLRDLRAASSGRRGPTSNIPAKYSCLPRGIPNFANTQLRRPLSGDCQPICSRRRWAAHRGGHTLWTHPCHHSQSAFSRRRIDGAL